MKYLKERFYYSNHNKYRKYCDEWISNLTFNQLQYFKKERRDFLNIKTF